MAVFLSPVGGVAAQFFTNTGAVLTGGKLYTYLAGTTTPAATYTSAAGATFNTNPIVLDAAGRVPGSGEIWLGESVQYKFVLKDSNDVLIGTYDNVTGINSNFINYNALEEIQTATAGQTVFTLTNSYQPGTNTLSVFVDGVNQYDGSSYSYVETSSTVVTFTQGLHVGALVKFTTAVTLSAGVTSANLITFTGANGTVTTVSALGTSSGSDLVGYLPAGTGAAATTVQTKLRQYVSVKDFGAKGDGTTDDGAAINACFAAATTGSVYIPFGTYMTSVEINTNGKSFYGDGISKTIIKATATSTANSVMRLTGTDVVGFNVQLDASNQVNYAAYLDNFNIGNFSHSKTLNAKLDGVYLPTTGGTSGTVLDGIWSISNGSTYSTGTASVSAGGTVVTIAGATNLTTLGYRATTDFLKVGSTQRAREIVSISSNTVTVYPAFDTAETSVAYSLRQGSGINIDINGNNSKIKVINCTLQSNKLAGLDERSLYGTLCMGNISENNEFGRIINRRSVGGQSNSCEDIGCYNETQPSGDYLIGGVNGFDIINENADAPLAKIVFQPQYGTGVRIRLSGYDLSEITQDQTNVTNISPLINTTQYIAGAQNAIVTLPDVPADTSNGAGQVYIWRVRLVVRVKSGFNTTIKSSTYVNGVAGATGVVVTGDYKVYNCYYQPSYGWIVQV